MQQQMIDEYEAPQWEQQMGDLPVGEVLRRTRMHYGLGLPDVEHALRIRSCLLGAIEDGRHDLLPGRVYAIGFVRAYSEYLGLDGDKMVYLYKKQAVGGRNRPELSLPAAASESKLPGFWILGGSGAALVVLVCALIFLGGEESGAVPIPDAPLQHHAQQRTGLSGALTESPVDMIAAVIETVAAEREIAQGPFVEAPPASRITLKATDNVWIEIRNAQGETLLSRILEPGYEYDVPNESGIVMDTGNAGALELYVDGLEGLALGEEGDVKRQVEMNPDIFLEEIKALAGLETSAGIPVENNEHNEGATPVFEQIIP